jgi:glycine C-acetyltransferase
VIAGTALFALQYAIERPVLRENLWDNTRYFREQMQDGGFIIPESAHPIVPVMIGDAVKTNMMARRMLEEGIYVVGFSYPVVPEGKARIRVQISAAHTREDIDRVVGAFVKVRTI